MAIALTLLGACHSSQTQKTSYCRLFIVAIFFFLLHDEMTLAVSKDALCFVKQRENQIVLTIGALLHYTDVKL